MRELNRFLFEKLRIYFLKGAVTFGVSSTSWIVTTTLVTPENKIPVNEPTEKEVITTESKKLKPVSESQKITRKPQAEEISQINLEEINPIPLNPVLNNPVITLNKNTEISEKASGEKSESSSQNENLSNESIQDIRNPTPSQKPVSSQALGGPMVGLPRTLEKPPSETTLPSGPLITEKKEVEGQVLRVESEFSGVITRLGDEPYVRSLPVGFKISFSSEINPSTLQESDFTNSGTAPGVSFLLQNQGDDKTFTLQVMGWSEEGSLIPTLVQNTVKNKDGKSNPLIQVASSETVWIDLTPPTVEMALDENQRDLTTSFPVSFQIQFSENIQPDTFDLSDIVQMGTSLEVTWQLLKLGDSSYKLTALSGREGTLAPQVVASAVSDLAGNQNSLSNSQAVLIDLSPPSAVIHKHPQALDPTNVFPASFTVSFSEKINPSTFTIQDITQKGTSLDVVWNLLNTGDDQNFILEALEGSEGSLMPTLLAEKVEDWAGNLNRDSPSTQNSIFLDFSRPSVMIIQAASMTDPQTGNVAEFEVHFSEKIETEGLSAAHFHLGGTASGCVATLVNRGDNQNFLFPVSCARSGTVTLYFPAHQVSDGAGNLNEASQSQDNSIYLQLENQQSEVQPPILTETSHQTNLEYLFRFSQPISAPTFTGADVKNLGTAKGCVWSVINLGNNQDFILRPISCTQCGTLIPSIAVSEVLDMSEEEEIKEMKEVQLAPPPQKNACF